MGHPVKVFLQDAPQLVFDFPLDFSTNKQSTPSFASLLEHRVEYGYYYACMYDRVKEALRVGHRFALMVSAARWRTKETCATRRESPVPWWRACLARLPVYHVIFRISAFCTARKVATVIAQLRSCCPLACTVFTAGSCIRKTLSPLSLSLFL